MVVFDTNVLVSAALIQGSRADRCVRAALEHQHPLIFSKATFEELSDVLLRSKLDRYAIQGGSQEFAGNLGKRRRLLS